MGQVIYNKEGQPLLQSESDITKQGNFITKLKRYYKVEQLLKSRQYNNFIFKTLYCPVELFPVFFVFFLYIN